MSDTIQQGGILSRAEQAAVLDRALVPEHSVAFMRAMSGGRAFCRGDYLFLAADDWLMGMGYPLAPPGDLCAGGAPAAGLPPWRHDLEAAAGPEGAFAEALEQALAQTGADACFAVAPKLPSSLRGHLDNEDVFYVLPANAAVPASLRGPLRKAAGELRVTEDREFTPAHRRLWAEFLGRVQMRPNVRALYAGTEAALAASKAEANAGHADGLPLLLDLRLLSAWNEDGSLAASLLLDYSPRRFCAYIIGAHSKERYAPHATDLLFARMLDQSHTEGKLFVHLGLGVNPGITRFKKKWGGQAVLPYVMASWRGQGGTRAASPTGGLSRRDVDKVMEALLSAPAGMSKRQIFDTLPKQREFAMLREVRKGDKVSWLCGTAHFFCYSFDFSFRRLFEDLDTIIFEGPLDEDFLAAVERSGTNPAPGAPRAGDELSSADIARLERVVYGPEGFWARLAGVQKPRKVDVHRLLFETQPWYGFFSLWTGFLERHGWDQSVDLEAWRIGKEMGKAVIAMENLEEQLASLESVPPARITDFLRRCEEWPAFTRRNIRTYLEGDLMRMMGSSIEFPTRTKTVINMRDQRFRERMRPFLEQGRCAVFVGSAHLLGLIPMLREDGFSVSPAYPSLGHRLRAGARRLLGWKEY